jgi:hypothetical protein
MKQLFLLVLLPIIMYFSSCKEENSIANGKNFEGYIEYSIEYPLVDSNNSLLEIMPEKMTVYFKDHQTKASFSAMGGLFMVTTLTNLEEKSSTQLVKILNKRLKCTLSEAEIYKEISKEFIIDSLVPTNQTKQIFGIDAQQYIAYISGTFRHQAEFYESDSLFFESPYWCTPFKNIKNILLEYNFNRYNISMKLKANKIVRTKVDKGELKIPDDFKEVPVEEINRIFEKFKI